MTSLINLFKKWFFNYDKSLMKMELILIIIISLTAIPLFYKLSLVDYDNYTNKTSVYITSLINEDKFKKEMLRNDITTLREDLLRFTTGFSKVLQCENPKEAEALQSDFEFTFNGDVGFLLIDKNTGRTFSNRNWFKDYPYSEIHPKEALVKLSQEDDVIIFSSEDITHYKTPYGYYNGAYTAPNPDLEEIYFIRGTKYTYIANIVSLRIYLSIPFILLFLTLTLKHLVSIKRMTLKNYLLIYSNIIVIRGYKAAIFTFTHIGLILKRILYDKIFIYLGVFWIIYLPLSYLFNTGVYFTYIPDFTGYLLILTMVLVPIAIIIRVIESVNNSEKLLKYLNKIEVGDIDVTINPETLGNFKNLGIALNKLKINYTNKIEAGIKNEKLKTELITNVSHDLKTPLTSIVNYVDILKDENLSQEEIRDYISILDNKATRLQSLVEDLFEMSKMTSGQIILEKSNVDMVELIHQNLGELAFLGEDKHLTFKVIGDKSCIVNVDGARMSRVMDNLICNAIKYSLENSRVYLSVINEVSDCVIEVKNISKYDLDFDENEILERFVRGEKSRTSSVDGSGLGLAIAKTIIELHNGTIKIKCDGDLFKVIIKLPIET
ncbi:sensor histidine kinase [Clostridium culturomicium]|uniref:sensor histidine kinase n=1 Tax=Clostridium culturomicium TaxID=1499683 RepID=UPI000694F245|nr:HAMP domain-containing sensor histidine kinase [Clostridium culturomicium]